MKTIKTFALLASVCAAVLLAAGCKDDCSECPDPPRPETGLAGTKWKCVLEHLDVVITLTVDPTTDLVSVSKSPKEMRDNDFYHQFRNGDLYFSQNDTLYLKVSDDNICANPNCDYFKITKFSEDEMGLEYLGILLDYPLYIRNYLFNRTME